jgi:hypothetical protein
VAPAIPQPVAAADAEGDNKQWLEDLATKVGEKKPDLEDVGEWEWAKQRQAQRDAGATFATPQNENAVHPEEGRRSTSFPGLPPKEVEGRGVDRASRMKLATKLRRPPIKPKFGARPPMSMVSQPAATTDEAPVEIATATVIEPIESAPSVMRRRFVVPDDVETA